MRHSIPILLLAFQFSSIFLHAQSNTVSPELGGPGFEKIAASLGWQTNTIDPADYAKYYADTNAKKGGIFRFAPLEGDFPATLRPFGRDAQTVTIQLVENLVYQPLITLDPVTLEFLPTLATHWKVGEDGQTYFFRIDPNARFSDGHSVTVEDVLATYRLWADPTILDPFQNGLANGFDPPQKISTYMFSVRSKEKNWKNMLYFGNASVLPAHQIGKMSGSEFLERYQYELPVGSGPYMLLPEGVVLDESVTLTRNKEWWNKDEPLAKGQYNFDEIRLEIIPNDMERFEWFLAGDLDAYTEGRELWWRENFNFEEVQRGLIQRRLLFTEKPQGINGFVFNMRRPPFNDVRVRKAFTLLFNREMVGEQVMYNAYRIVDSYFPNSEYANPNNPRFEYDPEGAEELLREAGYTRRNKEGILVHERTGKPFIIELPITMGSEHVLTPVQNDLMRAGIRMDIRNVDWSEQIRLGQEREFDIMYVSYTGIVYPNPFGQFHSSMADIPNTQNLSGFSDPLADELMELELETFDHRKRVEILREIDSLLISYHPYALSWYGPSTRVAYWNWLDHPDFGFSRNGDYRDIFIYWWYDPEKGAMVERAFEDASVTMPVGEMEVRFWEKVKSSGR